MIGLPRRLDAEEFTHVALARMNPIVMETNCAAKWKTRGKRSPALLRSISSVS